MVASGYSTDPDLSFGAGFIGMCCSCVLLGIQSQQTYTYYQKYPGDRPYYKILVALVWLLEIVDQAFICHALYYYTITNASSPLVLLVGKTAWTLIIQSVFGALVGSIVKGTFVFRIWRFSHKNILLTGGLSLLVVGELGLATFYCIRGFHYRKLVLVSKLEIVASLSLGTSVFADIAIAASLCFILRNYRTGFRSSDITANTLMLYAVNTGALTSVFSLATLILYNIMPNNCIFIGFYFVLSKLYAISLLATLNTRKSVRGKGTDEEGRTNANSLSAHVLRSVPQLTKSKGMVVQTLSQTMSVGRVDVRREIHVLENTSTQPRYSTYGW